MYAGLIFVASVVFIILSMRYEYVDESEFISVETPSQPAQQHHLAAEEYLFVDQFGVTNRGFSADST